MFKEYAEMYMQKDESFKKQGLAYSIYSNGKRVGVIQEIKHSSWRNIFIKLLSLLFLTAPKRMIVEELELEVLDEEEKVLGTIEKNVGFFKDLTLFIHDGELIATVQSTVKTQTPSLTVLHPNGESWIQATGGYGAIDFSVNDSNTTGEISTIRKRSIPYSTMKENLLNNDAYYFQNSNPDGRVVFLLIGLVVAIDLYFHLGE
ncbi:hypothetical protein [Radiobacillus deserti]|uniref:Uncharacterized protein n=1 Tax=Radiobacillus deserti TaxID=2594883 RepID=A0A516KJD3_9BACI|nr:hypothetical protein [Radiobacillus deserti]QDP41507.1 hypothetical protein FN924_15795 [Radiobacillus deserti]